MFNTVKPTESKMKIKLLQTRKLFRTTYGHKGKKFVFNVTVTDAMEGFVTGRMIEIKRMKYHKDDCDASISRGVMKEIKADITKRFE
jgi:predicted small secreted protein